MTPSARRPYTPSVSALPVLLAFAAAALAAPKTGPSARPAAASEPCTPAPPSDELPPAADRACPASAAPTAARLRPDSEGACGSLHRRVIHAASREWAGDLDPAKGRLIGPLEKESADRRVVSLWNQDSLGKAACERSPQIALCDPRERSAWLAELLKADALLIGRARVLFTWYVQAHKTCESATASPGEAGLKSLEQDRRRFSAELRRLLGPSGEADRLSALHADYGASALDPRTLKAWDETLAAWTASLPRPAARSPARPKPKRTLADTAPPD